MADNFFAQFHQEQPGASGSPDNFFAQFHANDGLDEPHRKARAWIEAHPEAQHSFANNLAEKAVQGLTLGYGDEMRAGLGAARDYMRGKGDIGQLYDLHKAMQDEQQRLADRSTGAAGTVADIAGSFLPAGIAMKGVNAASRLPGVVNSMIAGAGVGGTEAGGNGRSVAEGAALGAGGGLLGEGLAMGLRNAVAPPTTQSLLDAAKDRYAAFDASPGVINHMGVQDLATRIDDMFSRPDVAADPKLTPRLYDAYKAIGRYTRPTATGAPPVLEPKNVQTIGRLAGLAADSPLADERRLGVMLKNEIGSWADSLPQAHVTGPVDVDALRQGNAAYARYAKARDLEQGVNAASQKGGEQALRNVASDLVGRGGLTGAEMNQAQKILAGGRVQNAAKAIGDVFGLHNPAQFVAHSLLGTASGGMEPIIGVGAEALRQGSRAVTAKRISDLDRLVRTGSVRKTYANPHRQKAIAGSISFAGQAPGLLGGSEY